MSPGLWVKPLPGASRSAIGREHRAEEERRAVGILMVRADHLRGEIGGIAADLGASRSRPRAGSRPRPRPSARHPSLRTSSRLKASRRTGAGTGRSRSSRSGPWPCRAAARERPSKSRRLTSLPSVAPTIAPLRGDHAARPRAPDCSRARPCGSRRPRPCRPPTSAGVLVKISASGPMPTSRYCDQAPCAISASFSRIAAGEPGFSLTRSSPISLVISARIAAAALRGRRARAPRSPAPASRSRR